MDFGALIISLKCFIAACDSATVLAGPQLRCVRRIVKAFCVLLARLGFMLQQPQPHANLVPRGKHQLVFLFLPLSLLLPQSLFCIGSCFKTLTLESVAQTQTQTKTVTQDRLGLRILALFLIYAA